MLDNTMALGESEEMEERGEGEAEEYNDFGNTSGQGMPLHSSFLLGMMGKYGVLFWEDQLLLGGFAKWV